MVKEKLKVRIPNPHKGGIGENLLKQILKETGETKKTILKAYPYLESGDIDEASRFAALLAEEETVEFSR